MDISYLENQLNSFDAAERRSALQALLSATISGDITLPPAKDEVNLHFHTFFSFNSKNWSPSRVAWESVKYGLKYAGIVDFDVLDGMIEFLSAGELLGLRAIAGMESRVFISELSDKVMSSPNEPGVAYFMASGCYQFPEAGSESAVILQQMRETAQQRNIILVEKVNDYLDTVQLDYEADAVPLTPAGNVTERHLLLAYDLKARKVFQNDMEKLAAFWAEKLGISVEEAHELLKSTPKLHEKMRAKLMKYGGVGYIAPTSDSFPSIENAIKMILGMGAIPMIAWLDGTSPGESDAAAFLELLRSKGVVALNIIPDRNWNIKNPEDKALKVQKLGEIIEVCRRLHMPIAVGTEMNKSGLPFVDDFSAPELQPFVDDFIEGAECLYGHTVLAQMMDFGYLSEKSMKAFGDDWARRKKFFVEIGRKATVGTTKSALEALCESALG